MSRIDKNTLRTLHEAFKIIYPNCFDVNGKALPDNSIAGLDGLQLLEKLSAATAFCAEHGVHLKHADLAEVEWGSNACLTKYNTFMLDNSLYYDGYSSSHDISIINMDSSYD